MSFWGQLNLMDAGSPLQSEMFLFHDHAMILLLGIFTFCALLGLKLILNKLTSRTVLEAQRLETVWTIVPALLLIWLALPSLRLLYLLDEQSKDNGMILKATGHQWYWSYEVPLSNNGSFDSYMIPENDLNEGDYRLLEVDNRAVVPFGMETTVIVTSADVLHAWTLPSMGIKMDAVPGRLNSMSMFVEKPGVYYGQCSEICGANHSFMPIVVEALNLEDFCKLQF
uniref:cytochrome c oxidase subunit II n=1 Tax=Phyllidiella zeylanica TaxID=2724330 RepID=UPI002A80E809|nr:cytochrome c oxidase subunit II [Phyllidiella zeylanica]WNR50752.1 cytochrome c oxidase subunit II [Phyllidiella zeylanica]WNR50765.1 cytochrome c oxidase subunit II [Phyllidiella zeylanica]